MRLNLFKDQRGFSKKFHIVAKIKLRTLNFKNHFLELSNLPIIKWLKCETIINFYNSNNLKLHLELYLELYEFYGLNYLRKDFLLNFMGIKKFYFKKLWQNYQMLLSV